MEASAAEGAPTTDTTAKGTKYHVFIERRGSDGAAAYEPVDANVVALSDQAAIRATAKETGTYVAIPARSFKPTPVKISTETVVKIGNA